MDMATAGLTGTADLCDIHGDAVRVCAPMFRDYGGVSAFAGRVVTVRCFEDNSRVREMLNGDGRNRVLVVDAGGSLRCAMLGDQLARLALERGWSGVLMYGCVRDTSVLAGLPLGIKALSAHPRRSEKHGVGEVNVPVSFGGITFRPGDHLHADRDGVILLADEVVVP